MILPIPATRRTGLRRLLAVLVVAASVVLGTATAALAHTALQSSDPADGSTVAKPLPSVDLTFTGQVLLRNVTVTGPGGATAAAGSATASGTVVSQPVTLSDAGTYTVDYEVTSSDGHQLAGSVAFSYAPAAAPTTGVAVPSTPAASPSVEPSPASADTPAREAAGLPGWVLPVAAAVVLTGAVVLVLRRARAVR